MSPSAPTINSGRPGSGFGCRYSYPWQPNMGATSSTDNLKSADQVESETGDDKAELSLCWMWKSG
ncbi:unnamed protein product [Clavelina lepadiformis]|uniref:Uncharacterized protein n=1 Tax=Clavelina lepadiformis TaxID=159417 RepID=A0ABP0GQR0_CLALP